LNAKTLPQQGIAEEAKKQNDGLRVSKRKYKRKEKAAGQRHHFCFLSGIVANST
jgi:hypothetical protein